MQPHAMLEVQTAANTDEADGDDGQGGLAEEYARAELGAEASLCHEPVHPTVAELEASHRQVVESLAASHQAHVEQQEARHKQAVEEQETSHRRRIEELESRHIQTLQDLRTSHQQVVESLTQEQLLEVTTLKEQHGKAVTTLQAEHAVRLGQIAQDGAVREQELRTANAAKAQVPCQPALWWARLNQLAAAPPRPARRCLTVNMASVQGIDDLGSALQRMDMITKHQFALRLIRDRGVCAEHGRSGQ